jgi:hypothetical protein
MIGKNIMILDIIVNLISFLLEPDVSGVAGALFLIKGKENISAGRRKYNSNIQALSQPI